MGNIRRSRGYNFEYTLVKRLNTPSWISRRLGGSSTGLPDIVAVNNNRGILLTIEAKSGTGDSLYVPSDQIERCFIITKMFKFYKTRHVILAFKFMRKKRVMRNNQREYEKRKLIEYYKNGDILRRYRKIPVIKCTYSGLTFTITNNETKEIQLPNYNMPFKRKLKT